MARTPGRRLKTGLAWGRGGMLVLGQGVFFGLGGYMMAMHLKIADAQLLECELGGAEFAGSTGAVRIRRQANGGHGGA